MGRGRQRLVWSDNYQKCDQEINKVVAMVVVQMGRLVEMLLGDRAIEIHDQPRQGDRLIS